MSKDIAEFCKTCKACQLRKVDRISDRAPITEVARPSMPFEIVNIDVIGKIELSSDRGLYSMFDGSAYSLARIVPLRLLTAKATCNALLEIFVRTRIPNVIASDCGTNFTANLTQEFVKRIGSASRFSTQGYAEINGLIERWNMVL